MSAWDVLVVGAGPAGTIAAERLMALGHRVLLLDAGPRLREGERTPEVDRRAWAYRAVGGSFDWYRVRAVGGRAHLWGGWSYRFPDVVFRRGGWPYGASALAPYYADVERTLGVVEGEIDDRYRRAARALGIRFAAKRGAFRIGTKTRRLWTPLAQRAARKALCYRAALHLEHSARRADAVAVLDLRREVQRSLRARAFVLAASPVETARILLDSDVGPRGRRIGHGLVDHMVASWLLLEPSPVPAATAERGPFPGSVLAHGLVNTGPDDRESYPGGVSIEVSGPLPLEPLGVERMVPSGEVDRWSATQIHAIGEMFPYAKRYVDLDPAERDALGRRIPRIHLAWSAAERRMAADMRRACVALADAIAVPGSRLVPFLDPLQPGAGHEAGTCAMGLDEASVCDAFGRLRALENVWIADASVMPTAGDRHPTLTLLAHALRAADNVGRYLARGG